MADFNFTERKDIAADLVRLENCSSATEARVTVISLRLHEMSFPVSSRVILSAQRQYTYQRFDLGPPADDIDDVLIELEAFEARDISRIRFRLLVVSEDGKILGSSKHLSVEGGPDHRSPLLDMRVDDLGQVVWKLELDEETGPVLVLSSRLDDPDALLENPMFIACVLPEVVRRTALWFMCTEMDDDPSSIIGKWIRFLRGLGLQSNPAESADFATATDAADEIAERFAQNNSMLATFNNAFGGPSS